MTTQANSFIQETQMLIEANGASESFLIQTLAIAEEAGDDRNAIIELVGLQAALRNQTDIIERITSDRKEPFKNIGILVNAAAFATTDNLKVLLPFFNMEDPDAYRTLRAALEKGKPENAKCLFPTLNMKVVMSNLRMQDFVNKTDFAQQAEAMYQEHLLKEKTSGINVATKTPASGL